MMILMVPYCATHTGGWMAVLGDGLIISTNIREEVLGEGGQKDALAPFEILP